jgi:long-chain acyl-CoA synthetase
MATSTLIEVVWLLRVRLAISTAAKLSVLESENFFKKFNFELNEAYGIIEVGLPFVNILGDKNKRGSVGKLLPGYEIKLVDCDGQGVGKILLRGKGMFDAYLSPWFLRDEVAKDGWFDTGDLGYLDADGFLFIVGREKNLINFNGMKIFPAEVEAVINSYPEIKESRLYAKAHPVHGEIPVAQIVLKNGQNNLQLDDLRRFIYKNIDKYKAPKEFEIVSEIPKTASGKIIT